MSALLAIALLYWLPGAGLHELLCPTLRRDPRHDRLSRLALAAASSLALRPLLELWCGTAGLRAGPWLAWGPGLVGGLVLLAGIGLRKRRPVPHARRGAGLGAVDLLLALVVVLIAASRLLAVRTLVVPAWGDSVQHSVITRLLLDHRGLFRSWEPYAPMESFSYHFGFHSTAAAWAWITGDGAPDAVLWVGQITGVVAVLTLYPLTLELTGGSRVAGLGAILVGGLLSPMPAFYASWGRYTQLAGQALLPAVVSRLDAASLRRCRSRPGDLAVLAVTCAGLSLTHYRVSILAAAAFAVWTLAGIWRWRSRPTEGLVRLFSLAVVALGAVALAAPWWASLTEGILLDVYGTIGAIDPSVFSVGDVTRAWSSIPFTAPLPWIAAVAATATAALWLRDRSVALILAWSALCLLVTNPFVLGLPGMGFVTNFAVAIAAYIPVAVLAGWALAAVGDRLRTRPTARLVAGSALVAAALWGFAVRSAPVAPEFQLVTAADLRAFDWIREHTPPDAHFQVETALAYGGKTAVGTDGGWWLPLFTRRTSTLPPLPYATERMSEKLRHDVWAMPTWIRRSPRDPGRYASVLCVQGVTHVYLGDKRGSVGGDGVPLLPESALRADPRMHLEYETGHAQVWSFDREGCAQWGLPPHRRFRPRPSELAPADDG